MNETKLMIQRIYHWTKIFSVVYFLLGFLYCLLAPLFHLSFFSAQRTFLFFGTEYSSIYPLPVEIMINFFLIWFLGFLYIIPIAVDKIQGMNFKKDDFEMRFPFHILLPLILIFFLLKPFNIDIGISLKLQTNILIFGITVGGFIFFSWIIGKFIFDELWFKPLFRFMISLGLFIALTVEFAFGVCLMLTGIFLLSIWNSVPGIFKSLAGSFNQTKEFSSNVSKIIKKSISKK